MYSVIMHWLLIYLIKCYPTSEQLGPVHMINILLRPCLHQAKFCLFCQKICQQEAISSANDFVHRPKFSQLSPKFKDAIEKIWRPTIFCQATNSVVPWKLSFVGPSYFAYMTKFLYLTFLVRQKISHISDANKVVKTKKWWVQNFQDFFCRCTTLFFVVGQTGPKLVYFPCCTLSYIMSLFGLQWWLASAGSIW